MESLSIIRIAGSPAFKVNYKYRYFSFQLFLVGRLALPFQGIDWVSGYFDGTAKPYVVPLEKCQTWMKNMAKVL